MVSPEYMPDGLDTPEEINPTQERSETPPTPKKFEKSLIEGMEHLAGQIGLEGQELRDVLKPWDPHHQAESIEPLTGHKVSIPSEAIVNLLGGLPALPTEKIKIRTERGEFEVEWPEDPEAKKELLRQILGRVESTKEGDGGLVYRQALVEASQVISVLGQRPDMDSRSLSQEMFREFEARLFFHQLYLQYEKAGGAGDDFNILAQMRKDHLNLFFRDSPEIVKAFNKYEEKADDFLIATPGGREEIRKQITEELNRTAPPLSGGIPRNFEWAQRLGERLWEVTGREAIRERLLVDGKPRTLEEVEDLDKKATSEGKSISARFLRGDVNGGTFAMRRILKTKEALYAGLGPLRPNMKLLKDVDFQVKDYISWMIGGVETYHRNKIYQELSGAGLGHDEADNLSKEVAYLIVGDIFGGLEKEIPKDDSGKLKDTFVEERENLDTDGNPTGTFREVRYVLKDLKGKTDDKKNRSYEYEWSWPTLDSAESAKYVTNIKWDQIDFNIGGDNPMLPWALFNISLPDAFRVALTEETGSFLRKPSYESLKTLGKSLEYQQSNQYETRGKLLTNLIKFLRFDNRKVFGAANINFGSANNLVDIAARENFIDPNKKEEIKNGALEFSNNRFRGSGWRKLRLFAHYFNIFEFLAGILEAGAKSTIGK